MYPPFIWYIIGVRNIDILWQDAQGMLRDSAHLPTILSFLLIPCSSVLLTLVWTRLAQNYSQIVLSKYCVANIIRMQCVVITSLNELKLQMLSNQKS